MLSSGDAEIRLSNRALDFVQLRYAVAAADHGSLRKVAELFRVRHSIVSRAIRKLEHSLGTIVFERTGTGVKPTSAGRSVLKMARTILEQIDVLVATSRSIGKGQSGRLSVGFSTSIASGNLRATLLDFNSRFPEVDLVTVERSWMRLANSLQAGAIDVLIVNTQMPAITSSENKVLPLWSERVFAVLPDDHPLAARMKLFWTDIRGETVLLSSYDPGRELESLLMSKLVPLVDRPRFQRHDVSRGVVKSLVCMKFGIGLVMESDMGATFPGLVYREICDEIGPSSVAFVALWRLDNENPILGNFAKLLSERYPPSADSI